ncbi:MAG TPA: hypothetical protein VFN23_02180 [Ktedonobacteraceae bacterium]|nr:hypothetical protein [Ktedonobacteraceae bacterium]
MRRIPPWVYLIIVFTLFFIIFATVLIVSDFPFLVISMALTAILGLSALIVALAWAIQHDL